MNNALIAARRLAVIVSLVAPFATAAEKTQDVAVVNTPTVNVANTPTVNLAPNSEVTISSLPAVQIGNTSANPVIVVNKNEPAAQPFFQATPLVSLADGSFGSFSPIFLVPGGKLLVVEHVSVSAKLPTGQVPTLLLDAVGIFGLPIGSHFLVPTAIGEIGSGSSAFVSSQPMRMYVSAGGILRFHYSRNVATGLATCQIYVTGYLVDAS